MFSTGETETAKKGYRERDKTGKKQNYDRLMASWSLNTFLKLRKFLEMPLKKESLSTMTAFWRKRF